MTILSCLYGIFEKGWSDTVPCYWFQKDLPQGALEIPCQYLFRGRLTEVAKVKKVLTLVLGNGSGVHSFGSCQPDFRNSVDNTDGDVS